MEQQTKTTRELAIEKWWSNLGREGKIIVTDKYFPHNRYYQNSEEEKEQMYLSENPQTETIKEVDLTDASRLNDNTLYKFFRDENAALKQRIKELEREVISLRKNNSNNY